MPAYIVTATFTTRATLLIEADDEDQAAQYAQELTPLDFEPDEEPENFYISDIQPIR